MQIMNRSLISLILLSLVASIGLQAQMVEEKGVGELIFTGFFNIKTSDKQQALDKAKLNALQRYVGKFPSSKQSEYGKVRSIVESNVGSYVPSAVVLDEEKDKKAKTYRVVVRASIDAGRIDQEIQKVSAVSNVSRGEKSRIILIFMAREASETTTYGIEKQSQANQSKEEIAIEEQSVAGGTVAYSGESESSQSTMERSKNVKRSDKINYRVYSAEGINNTMSQIFTDAGYRVTGTASVEKRSQLKGVDFAVQYYTDEFSSGNDISSDTIFATVEACDVNRVKYFAYGSITVGEQRTDPSSGLDEVSVFVNGKVYMIDDGFEEVVASVGPVNYSAVGPSVMDAKANALKLAGKEASESLTSQLRAKNLY